MTQISEYFIEKTKKKINIDESQQTQADFFAHSILSIYGTETKALRE